MKNYLFILFITLPLSTIIGQEEKHFTQFSFNKMVFNPGYAGSTDAMSITAMYRNQWTTIAGAPVTFNLNLHTPISQGRAGIGFSMITDQVGIFKKIHVDAIYNYKFRVFYNSTLSIGLNAGLHVNTIEWQLADAFDFGDGVIPTVEGTISKPNFGVGFFLSSERYFVGMSAPRLLKSAAFLEEDAGVLSKRPYYMMGGMVLDLNKSVKLKPSMMVSLVPNAPFELDFSLSALFLDKFWIGGAYRLGDSFGALMQYELSQQLQVGVSFDFTISELRRFSGETMEFMMRYNLEFKDRDVRNIRYF
ncbi:MAG: type IX secretion system membrane protein PorP/SprF [Bacteroidia bacterium]|nr:type IX secretion system membrane protein PorP/SprF [Bacteroidia bacterium]